MSLGRVPVRLSPLWCWYGTLPIRGHVRSITKDIGDYLPREQKLQKIRDFGSIAGISDWQVIRPDEHDDWLDQRDSEYLIFMSLGSKEAKSQKTLKPSVATRTYSSGVKTNCDAWLYASDRRQLIQRVQDMIAFYEETRVRLASGELTFAQAALHDARSRLKWTREMRGHLQRNRTITFHGINSRIGMYRPFVKQHLYFDRNLIQHIALTPVMFPTPAAPNQVIGATGRGETAGFSTLITDVIPDLHLIAGVQWFSRWRYEVHDPLSPDAWAQTEDAGLDIVSGYRRINNITDWCLQQFRHQYPALHITKDDIWYYFYGLLHASDYRARYRADLSKDLPRIPFAPDFGAFREAGATLAALHLGYETCPEYELPVDGSGSGDGVVYRLSDKKMRWGSAGKTQDRSVLHVTPAVTLRCIPEAAHTYVVNGRTPLEWAIDRLHIRQDKESGIINDPNAWFADNPPGLVSHLRRLVHVSVATAKVVEGLSVALAD